MTASATIAVVPKQETRGDFQLVKKGITITLKVYFDFDKATLKPESHAALEAAAKIMKENPTIRVEIQGHTDNIGTAAYNDKLSLRRAQAVVDYLVGTLGVDPGRLTAKGYGLTRPVASDETREGRAQNRRVEFLVIE
jgi:outer membrane protein OmpA-like peptidoglycan-associated protein